MRSFLATLGFLTIVPIPRRVHEDRDALKRAVWWFPVVGLVVGGLLAALDALYGKLFPPSARAVLTVISWVALTRGLHMDGVADTADGLLSYRSRDKILEIMREPRTGPMGVIAVTSVLALKMTLVHALSDPVRGIVLFLAALSGRCAMGMVMGFFHYAREHGLASALEGSGLWKAVWSAGFAIGTSGFVLGVEGALAAGISLFLIALFGLWIRHQIGGYTGDTLGASCEFTEAAWLMVFVAIT